MAAPHDQNTKMYIFIRANIPSTQTTLDVLIKRDQDARTDNDATKKFQALQLAAAAS
jgi:hypothetical protein